MKKSYEYFLELSNSMHFTKAAEKLYITQQALSDQINRLEAELGVQLLIRRPRLRLTPAGEALLDHIKKLQHLERNLNAQLSTLNDNKVGEIRIGMHNARASLLLSDALVEFNNIYPNVSIQIISDQTRNYSSLLKDGAIDFYLGINAPKDTSNELVFDTIGYETMYLVVHSDALRTIYGKDYDKKILDLYDGVDLNDFVNVPFIFAGEISHGQQCINRYLLQKGIQIHPKMVFNDYSAQYRMIGNLHGACFTYRMMIPRILEYNESLLKDGRLYIFPLIDFKEYLELSLVSYKGAYFFPFTKYIYDLIRKSCFENIIRE